MCVLLYGIVKTEMRSTAPRLRGLQHTRPNHKAFPTKSSWIFQWSWISLGGTGYSWRSNQIWTCFCREYGERRRVLAHHGAWLSDGGGWTKACTQLRPIVQLSILIITFLLKECLEFKDTWIPWHACRQLSTFSKMGRILFNAYASKTII